MYMMEISVTFLLTGCLIQGVFCGFSIRLPKRVEALEGSCVIIPCTFDIDQEFQNDLTDSAKRIWYKDGTTETLVFDSSRPNTGLLKGEIFGNPKEKNCTTRFDNLSQRHNGSYYFRLEGSGKLRYSYANLKHSQVEIAVIDSPPKPTVSLLKDQEEVTEGSSVNLRCSTKIFCSSRPAVLTWSSSPEHLLKENVTQQQRQEETELISDLIFTVTHRHHSATFTCTVTLQLQQKITKSQNESRTLRVQYAPKNTSAHVNPSGFVLEGRSVTLSCSSDANPPELNYTWYRDTEEPLKPVQIGQNLTINNTNPTHSGRYVCTAQNKHGAQNASVELDVQYAPKNTSAHVNPSGFVLEGRSVTLSCSSDANPPELNYTWYRDTEPLKPVQTGQNLTINNTNPTHSGRYVCTAQNKHGAQNASVELNVQYAPKNTTLSLFPSGSVIEGRPVTLTCSTDAKPAVLNFSWYIETGSQFKLLQTGFNNTYVVSNPTNGARYRCTAQNQHGQHNTTIQLDAQFAPKISISCNQSSVITCVCEAHGNPSPTLEWRLSGNVLANSTNTSISNETPGNTSLKSVLIHYQPLTDTTVLQCFSANTHGTAGISQKFHPVTPTPKTETETETRFHHPSMLLGAAVGALAMMILCIMKICYERRRNPKASEPRQDDRSGLILTQIATASDGDGECVYAVTHKPPESPHYSTIDFMNAEPASGEIRGASSLTDEYAVVRHRSVRDAASATDPKKDQSPPDSGAKITDVSSEDTIYENMTRRLVV